MTHTETTVQVLINGALSSKEVNDAYEHMNSVLEQNDEVNLLVEIRKLDDLEIGQALFSGYRAKWNVLRHLRKYALVTDLDWLENYGNFASFITPGIEMKVFDLDEKQKALEWINKPTKNEDHGLAFWSQKKYLHLMIYDTLTQSDYKELKWAIANYGPKVSLLIEFGDFDGLTAKAIWEDLKMAFTAYGKLEKVAVVSESGLKTVIKAVDFLTPGIDIKSYIYEEILTAMEWLNKK